MKKKLALLAMFATVAAPVATMLATLNPVEAASITNVTVTLGSQNQSTATSTVIAYTAPTAIGNGSVIEVSYDTGFTGGAALTSADVVLTGTGISGVTSTLSGQVAGYFKLTVTAATGTTTSPVLTLNGTNKLTTPATAGNYDFSVVDTVGANVDSGAGLAYVSSIAVKENQVLITATVPPVIAMDLFQAGSATKLTDPNTCPLGVLTFNTTNTCSYDIGIGTNDTAGATVKTIANTGLTNGTYTLANAAGAITSGTEAYGFAITSNGTVPFTPAGSFATQYQAVPLALTTFATSAAVSNIATTAQHFTVRHAATMSTSTPTGSYTSTQSYQAFTN